MTNEYGVEMTSFESMLFQKYLSNNGISMNTKSKEERKQIALEWKGNNGKVTLPLRYQQITNSEQSELNL